MTFYDGKQSHSHGAGKFCGYCGDNLGSILTLEWKAYLHCEL